MPSFVANKPCLNHFIRESAKNAKKTLKRNLADNFKQMFIFLVSTHLKTITYTKQCCGPSFVPNKQTLHYFMRESAKSAKQPQKRNFACNLKNMSIVFDSNHFHTITYNILYCIPSFVPNKPSLNHFMRECRNMLKKTSKTQRCMQFKAYDYCFRF